MKRRVHQSLNGKQDGFEARGIKSEARLMVSGVRY